MIGTFRSIGATRRMTSWVLLTESLMYGLMAALAVCSGLAFSHYSRHSTCFHVGSCLLQYSPRQLGAAMLLALVISF